MEKTQKGKVDWLLLVFLLLFTNQAVFSLKILGLVFICIVRFNWQFGFGRGRLPRFYPYILLLALFNFLFITREFTTEYTTAFIIGNLFWIFSAISSHHVKLSVERYGPEGTFKTIKVYTILNFIFCIGQLINVMLITGKLNPYDARLLFPYGMSTGDNIFGTFMQNSYYNIMVSAILAIYFIFKRNIVYAGLAIACFVLVFGNFGTIIFVSILAGLFVTGIIAAVIRLPRPGIRPWLARISPPGPFYLYIPGLFLFIALLYYVISPKNFEYVVTKFKEKIFSIKKEEKNNYATLIGNQKPKAEIFNFSAMYFERLQDSLLKVQDSLNRTTKWAVIASDLTAEKTRDGRALLTRSYIEKLQGKNLSVFETIAYLKSSGSAMLFGAGTTRFSSLTAQKMSGNDSSRLFLHYLPRYISKEYSQNHLLLIEEREKSKDKALLSTANWPDSLYNQLFGEYGVLGFLIFVIFYIGFFLRFVGRWTYSFWILLILFPFAHLNYVFDTLCVIPFFELLMFADIAKKLKKEENT